MYKWIRPFLFTLSPEAAHNKTLKLLKSGFWPSHSRFFDECLMIDLIARKKDMIIFIEVKNRADFETGAYSISDKSKQRISNSAKIYMSQHPEFQVFNF